MLARGMIEHHVHENGDPASMRFCNETLEIVVGAIGWFDAIVVADVIAVVAGGCGHRHEPDARRAEAPRRRGVAVVDVIEFLDQSLEVADAVAVAVVERPNEDFVAGTSPSPRRHARRRSRDARRGVNRASRVPACVCGQRGEDGERKRSDHVSILISASRRRSRPRKSG